MRYLVAIVAMGLLVGCGQTPAAPGSSATRSPSSSISSPASPPSSLTAATSAASSAKPTTPAVWTISSDGLGPLVLGTPYSAILGQGLVVATPSGECRPWDVSPALAADGVSVDFSGSTFTDRLIQVSVHTSKYATVSGARVGMTLHQIQGIYGTRLVIETKEGDGGPFEAAVVRAGGREVAFLFPWDIGAIDTAPVQTIVSRDWSTEMHGGC